MNYLYLKPSSEPLRVGDLTIYGIVDKLYGSLCSIKTSRKRTAFQTKLLNPITPLLIMDAPEEPPAYRLFGDDPESKEVTGYIEQMKKLKEDAILFHSNEQAFNYLKSKGIKPEAEMLIEFDGEVEIKSECISPLPDKCTQNGYPCPLCNKVAIIKENQEEDIVRKASIDYGNRITNPDYPQQAKLDSVYDFYNGAMWAIEHFKIEREK